RRLVLDQCDGLCPRQPCRLRPLGRIRADHLVLRACAALFPPPGKLGGRRRLVPRRRRALNDGALALPGSADRGAGRRRRGGQAERELILACGGSNSPQLLMLSGIGDPVALRVQGIAPRVPLPGVGRNLQDHIAVAVTFRRKEPGPLHRKMRADRIVREIAKARLRGRGIAASQPHGIMAFLKTASDLPMPDIQLLCSAAPLTAAPYFRPFVAPYEDSFACRAVLLRPDSRGQITLASRDPKQAPRIKQNFLAREADWVTLRAGVKLAREIGRQSALAPFVAAETGPGPDRRSDSEVDAYIRATAITVHHPLGTC